MPYPDDPLWYQHSAPPVPGQRSPYDDQTGVLWRPDWNYNDAAPFMEGQQSHSPTSSSSNISSLNNLGPSFDATTYASGYGQNIYGNGMESDMDSSVSYFTNVYNGVGMMAIPRFPESPAFNPPPPQSFDFQSASVTRDISEHNNATTTLQQHENQLQKTNSVKPIVAQETVDGPWARKITSETVHQGYDGSHHYCILDLGLVGGPNAPVPSHTMDLQPAEFKFHLSSEPNPNDKPSLPRLSAIEKQVMYCQDMTGSKFWALGAVGDGGDETLEGKKEYRLEIVGTFCRGCGSRICWTNGGTGAKFPGCLTNWLRHREACIDLDDFKDIPCFMQQYAELHRRVKNTRRDTWERTNVLREFAALRKNMKPFVETLRPYYLEQGPSFEGKGEKLPKGFLFPAGIVMLTI